MPSYIDIATAAQIADVYPATIRRYIAEGRLPARRMGPRLIRVAVADVEAFMQPIGA